MAKHKKYIIALLVIGILIFIYIQENKRNVTGLIPSSYLTKEEQLELEVETLKEKIYKLEEENSSLNSRLEEAESENSYSNELIELLQQQLEDNGIEPYEL